MSANDNYDMPPAKLGRDDEVAPLGKVMDKYRDRLRVLRERRERALAEAEVAIKLKSRR